MAKKTLENINSARTTGKIAFAYPDQIQRRFEGRIISEEPENLSGYGMVGADSELTKDVIRVEMGLNQGMN